MTGIRPVVWLAQILLPLCLILGSAQAQSVRISNMNDFAFGTWGGAGALNQTDFVCIYKSAAPNTYRITLTGTGVGSAFTLASGAATLAYQASFRGSTGAFVVMTPGVPRTFSAANLASTTCGGGTNARIRIRITAADLLAADAGSYSGVLTVLLQP